MSAENVDFELPSMAPPPFQLFASGENPPSDDSSGGNGSFPSPNNTGMPDELKSGIENLSGYSMDDVQVHYNSDKPAQLQAHAYAQGTDIHLGPGQERHLPHEAWHVVQQKQGRVKPTVQMKGEVPLNDNAGLEKEADVMGDRALAHSESVKQGEQKEANPSGGVVQAKMNSNDLVPSHDSYSDRGRLTAEGGGEVRVPNDKGAGTINPGFTYHHIIPENKLEKFSELLQGEFMAENTLGTRTAYKRSMNPQWYLTHLQDNIGQDGRLLKDKVDDEYHKIETEKPPFQDAWEGSCQGPLTQFLSTLPNIILGNKGLELSALKGQVLASIPPSAEVSPEDMVYPIFQALLTEIISSFDLNGEKHTDAAAIQWNSNNLHRGPSTEIRLDGVKALAKFQERGFSDMELDGGDDFELSAANVIPPEIFNRLNLVNELIGKVLELEGSYQLETEVEERGRLQTDMARLANDVLTLLTQVNEMGGVVPRQYNANEWQFQESPSDHKTYASMTDKFADTSPQAAGYDIHQDAVGVRGNSFQEYTTPKGPERDAVTREITVNRYTEVIGKCRTDITLFGKQIEEAEAAIIELGGLDEEFAEFNRPVEERMNDPKSQNFEEFAQNEARKEEVSGLQYKQADILDEGVESDGLFSFNDRSREDLDEEQTVRYDELEEQIIALEAEIQARENELIGEAERATYLGEYEEFKGWKEETDKLGKAFAARLSSRDSRVLELGERIENLNRKCLQLAEKIERLEIALADITSNI